MRLANGFKLEKFVKTKIPHVCEVCGEIIPENTKMFYEQGKDGKHFYRRYTCEECKNRKDR